MQKRNPAPPLRILVAPLDWGLGHATRCIPLIRYLQECGCDVWIASEGPTQQLLLQEFPSLTHIALSGYNIRYSTTKIGLIFKILAQIPRILQTIRYEHQWLKAAVGQFHIDGVVSDNRFGLHHREIPCVYLTHQLRIMAPFLQGFLQRLHYRYINRFDACWVPDYRGNPNLSGVMGHPTRLPAVPLHYLGPLSRLEKKDRPERNSLLVLLSGPEPQRTLFEGQILHQLETYPGSAIVVRGLPGGIEPDEHAALIHRLHATGRVAIHNHMRASLLEDALAASQWVVGRTGYTTVMDLVRLQKRSVLVSTPGQPEQAYLATYLRREGISYTVPQAGFSLESALAGAKDFTYQFPETQDRYRKVVSAWLASWRR